MPLDPNADTFVPPPRERDEGAYEDEDQISQDDHADEVCGVVGAEYKLSAKQLARYREKYPWFCHDESTSKSWCSYCKRWEGPSTAMLGNGDSLGKRRPRPTSCNICQSSSARVRPGWPASSRCSWAPPVVMTT